MPNIGRRTRLDVLVERHPSVEEVLHWHAIGYSPRDLLTTVEGFCEANHADVDQVIMDLEMAVEDALAVESHKGDTEELTDPDEASDLDVSGFAPDEDEDVPDGVSLDDAPIEDDSSN